LDVRLGLRKARRADAAEQDPFGGGARPRGRATIEQAAETPRTRASPRRPEQMGPIGQPQGERLGDRSLELVGLTGAAAAVIARDRDVDGRGSVWVGQEAIEVRRRAMAQ